MTARQLDLGLGPGEASRWTGRVPDRSGLAAYLHLVRAPEDPAEDRHGRSPTSWRSLRAMGPAEADAAVLGALEGANVLTFNAIGVVSVGRTADVLLDTPMDDALWRLLEAGAIERTTRAPIRWRIAGEGGR